MQSKVLRGGQVGSGHGPLAPRIGTVHRDASLWLPAYFKSLGRGMGMAAWKRT